MGDGEFGLSEAEKRQIKRRRALGSSAAIILALPATFILVRAVLAGVTTTRALPTTHLIIIGVSLTASFAVGWRPLYETWFGNPEVYVSEPEVGEDGE